METNEPVPSPWRHYKSHAAGPARKKNHSLILNWLLPRPRNILRQLRLSWKNFSIFYARRKTVEKFSFSCSRPTLPPDNDLAWRRKTSCRGIINRRPFYSNTNGKLFLPSNLWRDFFSIWCVNAIAFPRIRLFTLWRVALLTLNYRQRSYNQYCETVEVVTAVFTSIFWGNGRKAEMGRNKGSELFWRQN